MSGEKRGFEVDSAKVTDNRGLSSVAWFFVMMALQGCSNESGELERAFVKKLIEHKIDNVSSIDLREVFGIQWKKHASKCHICPSQILKNFQENASKVSKEFRTIAMLFGFFIQTDTQTASKSSASRLWSIGE